MPTPHATREPATDTDPPPRELVVLDRQRLTEDVVGIRLADPDGGELPGWTPGAHVDLILAGDLVRQYSLCGDPADRTTWLLAVLREPAGRGGSQWVHDAVRPRTRLAVRGPRNHFRLETAPAYLFIAGGIGITPIVPMVREVRAREARWTLIYGGRSHASMPFADELGTMGKRVVLHPQDRCGLLPLIPALQRTAPGTHVYACGPSALLDAAQDACAAMGRDLHLERFAPAGPAAGAGGFEVELARSGRTMHVPPDRTLLDVLEEAGVSVLSSCRTGTCGTCEVGVLAGELEHHDEVLTAAERAAGDVLLACTARARSARLVLDC
ncbi:MAG: ferredoxin [Pseudonocardia sp. SCN 72-86]|nr:MAG: ferredoxin [Pseudonocardia sp. SCN 72-86]